MKRILIFAPLIVLCIMAMQDNSVKGIMFPAMSGETLKDRKVSIPAGLKGKNALIVLAVSKAAEEDLKTWMDPLNDKFIAKTELLASDIHIYLVPMLSGAKAVGAGSAQEKMKKDVDPSLLDHIIVYHGDVNKIKATLKMTEKKLPYIFILDNAGKIIYSTSGPYSEDKMDKIEDVID